MTLSGLTLPIAFCRHAPNIRNQLKFSEVEAVAVLIINVVILFLFVFFKISERILLGIQHDD